MALEEKHPISPEDAQPELIEEAQGEDAELEELIIEDTDIAATAAAASEQLEQSNESSAQVKQLQQELEVARHQFKEQEESYVRLYADFENFRRRTQREKEELSQRERQKFVLEILPVIDSFEQAQQQMKLETEREKEIHNSYQGIYRLLVDALKKMGVTRMKAAGQPFDPKLHEAIQRQPNNDHPDGTVLVEFRPGYQLGEMVVRHAMVVVSARDDSAEAAPSEEGSTVSVESSAAAEPSSDSGDVATPAEEG